LQDDNQDSRQAWKPFLSKEYPITSS